LRSPYFVLPSHLFLSCRASFLLSCREVARHPSLRSGRRPGMSSRGAQAPRDPSAYASGRQPIHVLPRPVSAEGPLACARGDKKRPLGATASHRVFPRHASAEGSLTSFGMTLHEETPRFARGDKKGGSGRQGKGARGDKKGGSG
jgi:hypothetical protein